MKLEKVLEQLNSFEKNAFLKIIDNIISGEIKKAAQVEKILTEKSKDLKTIDNQNVARVFNLVQEEFTNHVQNEFLNSTSQLDILSDILVRDGNCILKADWFARLYDKELKTLKKKTRELERSLKDDKSDLEESRKRDMNIYKSCLHTAYFNDLQANQDPKITADEQSILLILFQELRLSQEEMKLINHLIIPIRTYDIDNVINDLRNVGILFFSKKNNTIYVPDEIVRILRKIRGKEVADKFFRRVLWLIREPQINLVCRKYNISWRQPLEAKIKEIINGGISFSGVLSHDIHREDTTLNDRKKQINALCDKGLKISPSIKGNTIEEKISNLIDYFEEIERDEKVGISFNGYEKLLIDIGQTIRDFNKVIKEEFELQDENVLNAGYLLDYNIKPRDVLEVIEESKLEKFCKAKDISTRGNTILNILDAYKDVENLYLENYDKIGFRDLNALKENGIRIKESDIGKKFEDLTKSIFQKMGFNVDEKLRRSINTRKDKIDIVLNLGNKDLILVECKTRKESGYNKFSSVSRQLKAYSDLVKKNGFRVIKSLLVAPEFSEDFISDCELEYDLNLSLITASALIDILHAFKNSKHKIFPYKLLMRDVLIKEERILKSISK